MFTDTLKKVIEKEPDLKYLKFETKNGKSYWVKEAQLNIRDTSKIRLLVTDEFPERHYVLQSLRLFFDWFKGAELLIDLGDQVKEIKDNYKIDENHTIIVYEEE